MKQIKRKNFNNNIILNQYSNLLSESNLNNKSENNKSENNESEDNETENNDSEDNQSEDNETENNDSEDNQSEDNQSEDNQSKDNQSEDNDSEDNDSEDDESNNKRYKDNKTYEYESEDNESENNDSEESELEDFDKNKLSNKNFKKEIERLYYTLNIYQNTIIDKMDSMYTRIINIEDRISRLEINTRTNLTEIEGEIVTIKEIKMERLDIDENSVFKALIFNDYRSVLSIFKLYYRSVKNGKVFYPIRIRSKRNFEYFLNNNWIYDAHGHYISKVIVSNIQTLFMRYNDILNKKLTQEEWLLNQKFITKLSEDKVKREMFKHIVDEIVTSTNNNSAYIVGH